jgi:hypothetical protein
MGVPRQPSFDAAMFRAALAYYGLPANYHRFFTRGPALRRFEERHSFMTVGAWWFYNAVPSHPEHDSRAGRLVWVQVNLPDPRHPLKKAEVPDIATYQNLTLDFEYPPDPAKAVAIGLELARHLLKLGLAEPHNDWRLAGQPSMPVESSGAGAHICLPLPPLNTAALGGPEVVNDAVHNLVQRYIQPQFDLLCDRARLDRKIHLDGYDLGHLFSLPGSWRPPYSKKDDSEALESGVLRRWYRDESQSNGPIYPRRRESLVLAELIVEECELLQSLHRPVISALQPADSLAPGDADEGLTTDTMEDRP